MITVFLRTVIFYLLTVVSLRIMGKRQLGELETPELVVTILISDFATMPVHDTDMPILYAVIPIVTLVLLEIFSSEIALHSVKYRSFLAGNYSVIIDDGVLDQAQMRRAQVTIDEVMEQIRQKGALNVGDVRFCVLETSGKMSVILKDEVGSSAFPIPLVVDGRVIGRNLKKAGLDRPKLRALLADNGAEGPREVFWLSDDGDGNYTFIRRQAR